MARYILKADKRMFPDNPRPNSLTNVYQATYQEIPTLPPGGTTGQVLTKESNLDYDVHWTTPITSYLTGANNGLSLLGTIVQLGGNLIKNTVISGVGFLYSLTIEQLENLIFSGTFMQSTFSDSITFNTDTFKITATNALQLETPAIIATTATVGQVLKLTNATTGEAEWEDEDKTIPVFISSNTLVNAGYLNIVDSTSGIITLTLSANPLEGDTIIVQKRVGGNNVNLAANVGQTISGASTAILINPYATITVIYDGVADWVVTSRYLT